LDGDDEGGNGRVVSTVSYRGCQLVEVDLAYQSVRHQSRRDAIDGYPPAPSGGPPADPGVRVGSQANGQRFSLTRHLDRLDRRRNNLGAELIDVVSRHELSTVATVADIDRPASVGK